MKKIIFKILIISFLLIMLLISAIYLLFPLKYKDLIIKYSDMYDIDENLVISVINIESRFKKDSKSKAGAVGLMQLLPSTAEEIILKLRLDEETDLYDEEININLGCYYLSYLLNLYNGNVINSLCAYNWGLNNVNEWINAGNVDENGNIVNIPVKETKNYITKYKLNYWIYTHFYRI